MKYNVEQVSYTALVLDERYKNDVILEVGNKKVVGNQVPRIGSNRFNYDSVNKYRFGCDTGRFNYKQLEEQIRLAEEAGTKDVDALLPIKGGNPITTEIVDESDAYYILKGGKAVLKANYTKGKSKPKTGEGSFGMFTYKKDDYWGRHGYYYKNNDAGNNREEILDAMYKAKAIIDFLEDKGDYAKDTEEVVVESK